MGYKLLREIGKKQSIMSVRCQRKEYSPEQARTWPGEGQGAQRGPRQSTQWETVHRPVMFAATHVDTDDRGSCALLTSSWLASL